MSSLPIELVIIQWRELDGIERGVKSLSAPCRAFAIEYGAKLPKRPIHRDHLASVSRAANTSCVRLSSSLQHLQALPSTATAVVASI